MNETRDLLKPYPVEVSVHCVDVASREQVQDYAEQAHIVNISSLFGLVGVPRQCAYNASKFAVRGFTEALRQEMAGSNLG